MSTNKKTGTISKLYSGLLNELLLRGKAQREFPVIGKITFLSAGSMGDFIMIYPDGTRWHSTSYAKRMDNIKPKTASNLLKKIREELK